MARNNKKVKKKKEPKKSFFDSYRMILNFMKSDGFFNNSKVNERMYAGDQWFHVSKKNKLPRIIINFIKRIVNFLVSAIMSTEVKLEFSPQPYVETDENKEEIELYNEYCDILNRHMSILYENLKMNEKNEIMIKDAFLSGIGLIHFFWDDKLVKGNGMNHKGDIKAEVVKGVNFFPHDPTLVSIQDQIRIHITYRDDLETIHAEAKKEGLSAEQIEAIQPDNDTQDQAFDKAQQEVKGSKKATVILTYEKIDGFVHLQKEVKGVIFKPMINTKKTYYPLVYMNGELREKSIYGTSPITEIVPNQIYVNTIYSMAMVSVQRTAYPTAVYDNSKITSMSNKVGGAYGVEGDINGAFKYEKSGQISTDVYNLVDNVIAKTKENQNANDALLGNVRPDNTSAILVNKEQSGIPLKTIERRFYATQENAGLILEEMIRVHMLIGRPLELEDDKGQREVILFRSDKYANIITRVKIDVGPSSQYSEIVAVNTLNDWLNNKHIDFVELLERYPKQIVPRIQDLIDSRTNKVNNDIMNTLPEEIRATIEALDEEDQKVILNELATGKINMGDLGGILDERQQQEQMSVV